MSKFGITQHHLVMPNDLNQHQTLFGGVATMLADLTGFICASLAYPNANFVTRHFEPFNFLSPASLGDILAIRAEVTNQGTTSVTISIEAVNTKTKVPIFSTQAVFVNVQNGKKTTLQPPQVS